MLTYHPALKNTSRILHTKFNHLAKPYQELNYINKPPMVAFRKCKSLKNLLTRSQLTKKAISTHKCNKPRCKTCTVFTETCTFSSTHTKKNYNILQENLTCTSSYVVYLITCTKCQIQYVGETTLPLNLRLNLHRQHITHNNTQHPVARHFNSKDHSFSNFSITPIQEIKSREENYLLARENFWINKLVTRNPHGLNVR